MTDVDTVSDAEDPLELRLLDAYRRYEQAYAVPSRPGTAAATRLARARLDLAMLLQLAGDAMPSAVLDQMARDAEELLRTTPALTDDGLR